jgi:replicative DNA helicase
MRGIATGFHQLDELTDGLQPGLIVLAGRPSVGKTSLALNIAQRVARANRCVAIFSLEMTREQVVLRFLTAETEIDARRMSSGFLGERDWQTLSQAIEALNEAKVYIDDAAAISAIEVCTLCEQLAAKSALDLVVIDYVQLMRPFGPIENRSAEMASISRLLKSLAKQLNVPILLVSGLPYPPESRLDPRPQLSDLRGIRPLDEDADVVLFLHRDVNGDPYPEVEGTAELIVAKQRNGPSGMVRVGWRAEQTRFVNPIEA